MGGVAPSVTEKCDARSEGEEESLLEATWEFKSLESALLSIVRQPSRKLPSVAAATAGEGDGFGRSTSAPSTKKQCLMLVYSI